MIWKDALGGIILTKIVKLYLISEQIDKDGNRVDYKEINSILWNLQKCKGVETIMFT